MKKERQEPEPADQDEASDHSQDSVQLLTNSVSQQSAPTRAQTAGGESLAQEPSSSLFHPS